MAIALPDLTTGRQPSPLTSGASCGPYRPRDPSKLKNQLCYWRLRADLTQEELAEAIGLGRGGQAAVQEKEIKGRGMGPLYMTRAAKVISKLTGVEVNSDMLREAPTKETTEYCRTFVSPRRHGSTRRRIPTVASKPN